MKNLHCTLLPLLLAGALAAPAPAPVSYSNILRRDEAQDTKICKQDLTKDMWVNEKYNNVLTKYLKDGPTGGGTDKAALAIVRSYAKNVDGFRCTPKDSSAAHCNAQDLGNEENCATSEDPVNQPAAVTILKAIANFANFIVSIGAEAGKQADEVRGLEGELTETFAVDKSANGIFGNSGPLIIASAFYGAIPVFGGVAGGIFGVLIGTNTLTAVSDGKFEQSMKFGAYVQQISSALSSSFANVADAAINQAPVDISKIMSAVGGAVGAVAGALAITGDQDGPVYDLPKLLETGDFADASSQTISQENKDMVKKVITAAGINSLWVNNGIYIARVSVGTYPSLEGKGELCGGETDLVPFDSGVKWCDNEGFMYVLQRWDGRETSVPGFDKLNKYGLDYKIVIQNSWEYQKRHGFSKEFTDVNIDDLKNDIAKGDYDVNRLQPWSIPVCDLAAASEEDISIQDTSFKCQDRKMAPCLFATQVYFRCPSIDGWPLGPIPNLEEGEDFPN